VVHLGKVTITKTVADSDSVQKKMLFTPDVTDRAIDSPTIAAYGLAMVPMRNRSSGVALRKPRISEIMLSVTHCSHYV